MRLFIALDLSEELRAWVSDRQNELKRYLPQSGLRWTPKEQWHVTLRFLGEMPEQQISSLLAAMKETAEEISPFSLSFGRPGTFSGSRMGVLWLGVDSGIEPLAQLAKRLNESLKAHGFPTEVRPFRGHITLARSRSKISSAELRKYPNSPSCPNALVDRLHLYQSVLDGKGAQYLRLHTVSM